MKYLTKFNFLLILLVFLSSCSVHNRLTSPEVLDKKERILTTGISIDPLAITELGAIEHPLALIQPVIGYRSGIGGKQEVGITLYGITGPALVIDHKHNYFRMNQFLISGDLALFGGLERPIGGQYDLIFGNQKLYGTVGFGYDFLEVVAEEPYYLLGIGFERIQDTPWGIQISYAKSIETIYNYPENFLSIGVKYDFLKTKRKNKRYN
jgi:hypothetical protein